METIQVGPTSEFDSRATHLHKQTHTRSHTCAHAHTRHSGVAPQMSFAAPRQRTPMQIFFLFFSSLVCQKTFLSFFSASPSASLCMCASLASLTHTRKHQELESGSVKKKKGTCERIYASYLLTQLHKMGQQVVHSVSDDLILSR